MIICIGGTISAIYETLHLMVQNGIPFIRHIRYRDGGSVSMGSRRILANWEHRKTMKYLFSTTLIVRGRDLDLIVLLSTAELVVMLPTDEVAL